MPSHYTHTHSLSQVKKKKTERVVKDLKQKVV